MKDFFKRIFSSVEDLASGMVAKWVMRVVMIGIGALPTWYQTHTAAVAAQEKIKQDASQTENSLTYIIQAVAAQQEQELKAKDKSNGCH